MTRALDDDDTAMLQAHVDGELDPATNAEIERRIANEPALRARRDGILELRRVLRTVKDEVPIERLNARIGASLAGATRRRERSWGAMAASALIGAVLAGGATFGIMQPDPGTETSRLVVASHVRGLLAPQPFDIASSDRHTVKPWFAARLPESPHVVDLASEGFPLVGGRVDVLGREPAATMVYRHDAHVISLTVLVGRQAVADSNMGGYRVKTWRAGDFTYVAVSDLPDQDIEHFARAFRAGLAQL